MEAATLGVNGLAILSMRRHEQECLIVAEDATEQWTLAPPCEALVTATATTLTASEDADDATESPGVGDTTVERYCSLVECRK